MTLPAVSEASSRARRCAAWDEVNLLPMLPLSVSCQPLPSRGMMSKRRISTKSPYPCRAPAGLRHIKRSRRSHWRASLPNVRYWAASRCGVITERFPH